MSPLSQPEFYRYQSCDHLERLERLLLRHQLYLPTAAELNDPAECRPRLTAASPRKLTQFLMRTWHREHPTATLDELVLESQRAQATVAHYGVEEILRKMNARFHERSMKTRIFSMSKRWNNMSMWAKYAGDHTGYCLVFANAEMFSVAQEVEYGDVVEVDASAPDAAHDAFMLFIRKSRDWSNEEEVRLIAPTFADPYVPYDPSFLTRVILGKDMRPEHRQRIREWAGGRKPALEVVEAQYDTFAQRLVLADPSAVATL